jgi:hypothetical protein
MDFSTFFRNSNLVATASQIESDLTVEQCFLYE